jgi:hypothetical protein
MVGELINVRSHIILTLNFSKMFKNQIISILNIMSYPIKQMNIN